jgi:dTDP-4-amino-4,6-dideoxygalactose transaminase
MAIPIYRPTLKRRDMGSVLSCIVSDKLGPGDLARDLVSRVSQLLGAGGGVTVSSPYAGLSLALEALGIERGSAVILPALAPAVHLRAIRDRGLVALLADADPESGCVDPGSVVRLAERGAKAVIVRHTLGFAADLEALRPVGLPLIEDVSQALGARFPGGAPCGGAGDLCLLSLEPEGIVTCGGGALVLGRSRQSAAALRRAADGSPVYAPLPDMNAALGVAQVVALERFLAVRREIASAYGQALLRSRHRPLVQKGEAEPVPFSFAVLLADGMKDVRAFAMKKNVETVPAFAECAATADEQAAESCPGARSLMLRCLLFPLYPMLARRDVETVAKVLGALP